MVQVASPTMLAAAVSWLLASSNLPLLVSGSPLAGELERKAPAGEFAKAAAAAATLIHWKGTLEEGQPEVELSGYNFQEIEAQAKALNPEYTIFLTEGQEEAHPAFNATVARRDLTTRQTFTTNCWQPAGWGAAPNWDQVWAGVHWLQSIAGNCRAGPGPGNCARLACSHESGIFYCNDNTGDHWEPCQWIGDVAGGIANTCNAYENGGGTLRRVVYGQAFDQRLWNTIVAHSNC